MGRGNNKVPHRGGPHSPKSNPTLKLINELQADVARIKAAAVAGNEGASDQGALGANQDALKSLVSTIEYLYTIFNGRYNMICDVCNLGKWRGS